MFDNKMSRTVGEILQRSKILTSAVYWTVYLAVMFFENLLLRYAIYFYSPKIAKSTYVLTNILCKTRFNLQ